MTLLKINADLAWANVETPADGELLNGHPIMAGDHYLFTVYELDVMSFPMMDAVLNEGTWIRE